ncbi:hypothetical protein GCM10023212_28820 [Luteolibacter yonseiensis]
MVSIIRSRAFSILGPGPLGLAMCYLSIGVFGNYGGVLFLGLPLLVSFLSAFFFNFRRDCGFGASYAGSVASVTVLGLLIIIVAMDGLICLLMALPLAILLALPGTALGRLAGRAALGRASSMLPLVLIFLFPCLVAFEDSRSPRAPLRSVTTSVEVGGSLPEVWKTVTAFPRIDAPPEGIFRMGIAYPIEATIEGTGVGAIRRCTFCTGDFVEPVTVWDENRLLAFDVISFPAPMTEFSIYRHIDPPHLHGHLASEKGQFRLERRGNKVLLEGTTWYRHEMWPQWYWIPMTDHIIHKIHLRVLDHIKETVEKGG